jgi:hypothetical protein
VDIVSDTNSGSNWIGTAPMIILIIEAGGIKTAPIATLRTSAIARRIRLRR